MRRLALLSCVCVLLSGCTEIMVGSHLWKRAGETRGCSTVGANKIGNTYMVDGQRYTPMPTSKGHREQGIASWYGEDFHGKSTANGECYNMYAFTAAHKTLPLPTVARVTNLENNKSVVVKVNDRGPFVSGRVIDLSYAAAQSLGMVGRGTAPVLIEAIGGAYHEDGRGGWLSAAERLSRKHAHPGDEVAETLPTIVPETASEEDLAPLTPTEQRAEQKQARDLGVPDADASIPPPPAYEKRVFTDDQPLKKTLVYVQVGAFGEETRATAEQLKLKPIFNTAHISAVEANGKTLSRVRAGPFRTVADAEAALQAILEKGWPAAQIVVER